MNLLLDANISWRISSILSKYFESVLHIKELKLGSPAHDLQIWEWAKSNGFVIVSNDEDFYNLLLTKGFPPKIILLRTGNQSNKYISDLLISKIEEIKKFCNSREYGVLELF